jgi:hypothetical protein
VNDTTIRVTGVCASAAVPAATQKSDQQAAQAQASIAARAVALPSTTISVPVMNRASSLARKARRSPCRARRP